MPDEVIIGLTLAFIAAIAIHAYQMGWNAGHDLHHDDDRPHHPKGNLKPPKRPNLYV